MINHYLDHVILMFILYYESMINKQHKYIYINNKNNNKNIYIILYGKVCQHYIIYSKI